MKLRIFIQGEHLRRYPRLRIVNAVVTMVIGAIAAGLLVLDRFTKCPVPLVLGIGGIVAVVGRLALAIAYRLAPAYAFCDVSLNLKEAEALRDFLDPFGALLDQSASGIAERWRAFCSQTRAAGKLDLEALRRLTHDVSAALDREQR